jgi:hypothetical protein
MWCWLRQIRYNHPLRHFAAFRSRLSVKQKESCLCWNEAIFAAEARSTPQHRKAQICKAGFSVGGIQKDVQLVSTTSPLTVNSSFSIRLHNVAGTGTCYVLR